jgi:hypothetical protein
MAAVAAVAVVNQIKQRKYQSCQSGRVHTQKIRLLKVLLLLTLTKTHIKHTAQIVLLGFHRFKNNHFKVLQTCSPLNNWA